MGAYTYFNTLYDEYNTAVTGYFVLYHSGCTTSSEIRRDAWHAANLLFLCLSFSIKLVMQDMQT